MTRGSRQAFAIVLLVGVAGTGVLTSLLNQAGYGTLGSIVWFSGYATTIAILWYGWFRDMDITGQTDPEAESTDGEGSDEATTAADAAAERE